MRFFYRIFLGFLLGWAPPQATAETPSPSHSLLKRDQIAVVDTTEVISRSVAWEAVLKKITHLISKDRSYVEKEERRLIDEEQNLKAQWEFASQESTAQHKKEEHFKKILETKEVHQKALSSLQERVRRRKTQLDEAFNIARNELHQHIRTLIDEIRTQKKLSLVFLSTHLVFFDSTYDITSSVSDRLNERLKTLPFAVDSTDQFWNKPLPEEE